MCHFPGVERWDGWVQLFVAIGGGVVAGFDVGEGDDTWRQRDYVGLETFGGVVSVLDSPVVGDEHVDVDEALAADSRVRNAWKSMPSVR